MIHYEATLFLIIYSVFILTKAATARIIIFIYREISTLTV